jgi:hypothetical protein
MDPTEAGRRLAQRHGRGGAAGDPTDPIVVDPTGSLLNYAERPHAGDWTLRSALVRLAQPEPVLVGTLLQVTRRLDAALHHVARQLERHPALCDPSLVAEQPERPPASPVIDVRSADVARLVAAGLDEAEVLAGYDSVAPLDHAERVAVPLLAVAVILDGLADELAAWADAGPDDPPTGAVERVTAAARARIDELGLPEETGPPPGARSRG